MACPNQTFTNVSQTQFDRLAEKAKTAGIMIDGQTGQASANGVTVRWNFDEATQTLEIQCTDSPFFLPCHIIDAKLREIVESCAVA